MALDGYLGYRGDDANTPFGEFFRPDMAPLPRHVVVALEHGPQAEPILPAFDDVATLADEGYQQTENGYGVLGDESMQVSVRTDMPGVTPAMWVWWFGWHGSDSRRYKLWHPRAHVYAAWKDAEDAEDAGRKLWQPRAHVSAARNAEDAGRHGTERYVGRTSLVTEYIGSTLLRAAIRFVAPETIGVPAGDADGLAVCARLGSRDRPVDLGWLVHHIRTTAGGAEMRSRFWIGGPHIAVHSAPGVASALMRPIASRMLGTSAAAARNLMVHCAQEMNHLAGFLPALYDRCGGE